MKLIIKRNRFWIEIIALGSGIAFAVALLIATLGAALSLTSEPAVGQQVESPAPQTNSPRPHATVRPARQDLPQINGSRTFEGMITCSQCGAKHAPKLGESAADCTRNCVRTGASFSLVNGERVYQLGGDPNILKKIAGQRARVVGVLHGDTIEVSALDEI
jgi:hypothetical protein